MDFKGITWAGNIYQKFEAMCLEVEEDMYEDTAKYVENQVQKVGVTVKKLYEEIVQDLLPISVDPVKAAGDLPLKPYTQTDINKKPKPSVINTHGELDKKETKDEDISDPTAEKSSLNVCNDANPLSPLSPGFFVDKTRSNVCSTRSKKMGVYKRPIGIKRIPNSNYPPKISSSLTSLSGDRSRLLACNAGCNCLKASDDMIMNTTRSLKFFVRNDPGEAATEKTPISDASLEYFCSDQNLSAEYVKQEKRDFQSTSASDKIISDESLRQEKDDPERNSSCHVLPTEFVGTIKDEFRGDGSPSQIKLTIGSGACKFESLDEEVVASYEDNFDVEVIDTDVLEPSAELFELVEKSNLEESCVLVELDKPHFVSEGTKKHKSYKKKICEVISSKLWSTRTQDQSTFHNKDSGQKNCTGVVTPALTMDCNERKFPARESRESDWELL